MPENLVRFTPPILRDWTRADLARPQVGDGVTPGPFLVQLRTWGVPALVPAWPSGRNDYKE